MKTGTQTEDAYGNPIYTFTVTFTEIGGEGRVWSGRVRETDQTIRGQWPRAVDCLARHFDIKATPIGHCVLWVEGKIVMTLRSGEVLEIPATATYRRPRIDWKYQYLSDPHGRTPLATNKVWIGRVGGEPVYVVRKVNGRWQSSSKDWHEVSATKAEAIAKCEGRASQ